MLPKNFRLTKKYQFNYVYKKGKSSRTSELTLFYSKNKNNHKRVGFCVTKKFGNAVERNHIKRMLRAVLKDILSKLSDEFNYIFIVKDDIKNKTYQQIYEIVVNMLDKNNLIKL